MTKKKLSELCLFDTDDQQVKDNSGVTAKGETKDETPIDFDALFSRLSRSAFRSRFYLNEADKSMVRAKGIGQLRRQTAEIIAKRLSPANLFNDGRQTPMRHGTFPSFIAQHATGCCCRHCLQKWHGIPQGRALTKTEENYILDVLMEWIKRQMGWQEREINR